MVFSQVLCNAYASCVSPPMASQINKDFRPTMHREDTVVTTKTMKMTRKENYCILCKKCVKEFCKHFENVHRNTPEGLKLKELNKLDNKVLRKKLKTEITDKLRKQGNAELTKQNLNEFPEEKEDVCIPVKRSSKATVGNKTSLVQCAHCQGYYRRRKFSQHLRICKSYLHFQLVNINVEGNDAIKKHALPPPSAVVHGASPQLINEVLSNMKDRTTKQAAMKDFTIMQYASEFHKTRRTSFQKNYVSRVITDLTRILLRMKELVGEEIKGLVDVFNPVHFSKLVDCILSEGNYNIETGTVETCGLANRLRSHIKGAAETAKRLASETEYVESCVRNTSKRKMIKHFLEVLKDKWANEVGRIFDDAVKMSRSENDKKLAAEEDIATTCQYVCSKYRKCMAKVNAAEPRSAVKQDSYNDLLDLLVTHIMCLIRRRPVDFKRGLNVHYEKLDRQEDLITEVKNSKYMKMTDDDINICKEFSIFYIPGKGWKEMVPIALTKLMKEAMECIQANKKQVGIKSDMLFVRARDMPVNPRESLRKVTKNLKLKKPLDMSANGLRHHAGTWSKLHSSHPQYQDYLASALGHSLHIHKLHYEMPTSLLQKLIVCPVLHKMTNPNSTGDNNNNVDEQTPSELNSHKISLVKTNSPVLPESPQNDNILIKTYEMEEAKDNSTTIMFDDGEDSYKPTSSPSSSDISSEEDESLIEKKKFKRSGWTKGEKQIMYEAFGGSILNKKLPERRLVSNLKALHAHVFENRSVNSMVSFLQSRCDRKVKLVTPEVKKFMNNTHRRLTNVPI